MNRLDRAIVHGPRNSGAGDQIRSIFRVNHGIADRADVVAGAAHSLHAAGDRRRRFDLDDQVHSAHIDAEFKRRGGDQAANQAHLELVFNFFALRDGDAAVVGAHQRFAGEFVDGAGNALCQPAIIDENQRGPMRLDQLKQLRMDGAPDRWPHRALRGGTAGDRVDAIEPGHIFHGHFDAQIKTLGLAGIHNRDGAIDGSDRRVELFGCVELFYGVGSGRRGLLWLRELRSAKEPGHFFQRPLGGGQADALQFAPSKAFQPLNGQGKMRAAFGRYQGVNFVNDDRFDGAQGIARIGGEQEVKRLGGCDEDIRRMTLETRAFCRGSVAAADRDCWWMEWHAETRGGLRDAD